MDFGWRRELPQWVVLAGMFLVGALSWTSAPDRVPVHWNLFGQVDRYGGRFEGLFGIPLVALVLYFFLLWLPRFDPRRDNYQSFEGPYLVLRLGILVLMAAIYGMILAAMRGFQVNVGMTVGLLMSGLWLLFAWMMPRVKQNYFVGIRTAWTLGSEEVWRRTHDFSGRVFFAMAVATALFAVLSGPWAIGGMLIVALAGCAVTIAYSHLVWKEVEGDRRPASG